MFHKKQKKPSLQRRVILSGLLTTVLMLIVCTMILLGLIYNVLRRYVQNDLVFVLQQTLLNMNDKTLVADDALLRIGNDNELRMILESPEGISEGNQDKARYLLNSRSGLYWERNISSLSHPFLDMVYLFDRDGDYVSCSYLSHNKKIQDTWDQEYTNINRRFQSSGREENTIRARNHINVIRKLYSSDHTYLGTVILGINENTFIEMASPFSSYPDSFWLISDKFDTRLLASLGNPMEHSDVAAISSLPDTESIRYELGHTNYMVCSRDFSVGLRGIVAVPENYFTSLLFGSVQFYLLITFAFVLILGIVLLIRAAEAFRPLREITDRLQQITPGQHNDRLPEYRFWEYNTISASCNALMDRIEHLINDVYEKKLLVMDSEMRYLQAQMDPHFMYNVLNTIALNAKIDGNEEVYRMTSNFMGLTQARLSRGGNPFVSLEQELQYVNFYLEIQQSRFEGKILPSIQVPLELYQAKFPKLALEMLVENAVKHGVEPKYGPGHVTITALLQGKDLLLTVEDDGVGFADYDGQVPLPLPHGDPEPGHNRIAINTTHLLIRHHYGDAYGLEIETHQGQGTRVQMKVPYEKWKDEAEYV